MTPWVLDVLKEKNLVATFFCMGKHLQQFPDLKARILNEGHQLALHGNYHINGFKSRNKKYIKNVLESNNIYDSKFFRPPYGKITPSQYKSLKSLGYQVVFWSLMPYDFDKTLSSKNRIEMIKKEVKAGDVIVLHDSHKAFPQLKTDLPLILDLLIEKNFTFKTLEQSL